MPELTGSDPQRPPAQSSAASFVIGFVIALALVVAAELALAIGVAKRRSEQARLGWVVVDRLAFTRDLEVGAVLTAGDLAAGKTVQPLAPSTYLVTDSAKLVGRTLRGEVKRGDIVREAVLAQAPALECTARMLSLARSLELDDDAEVKRVMAAVENALAAEEPR